MPTLRDDLIAAYRNRPLWVCEEYTKRLDFLSEAMDAIIEQIREKQIPEVNVPDDLHPWIAACRDEEWGVPDQYMWEQFCQLFADRGVEIIYKTETTAPDGKRNFLSAIPIY